jgi:pyruvate,water dikinase
LGDDPVTVLARTQAMDVVALEAAEAEDRFGAKAVQLGAARRAGLPVPAGLAVSVGLVDAVAAGDAGARLALRRAAGRLPAPLVARSSAPGEDGGFASVLNVAHAERLPDALARTRLRPAAPAHTAAVVQRLVAADVAGVLACGRDERVIEATWGLGETVVAGLVTPDQFRLDRAGRVLERRPGLKDVAIAARPGGGTVEVDVAPGRATALCLDDGQLWALADLAARCEAIFGGDQELGWAFAGDELFLLRRRAISA